MTVQIEDDPATSRLTEIERHDVDRICAAPLEHYRRNLKWHAFYAFGGFFIVVIGMVWLRMYCAPTVTQAMVFVGLVVFSSSLGYCITTLLGYKYIRIIQHLRHELLAAQNKLPSDKSESGTSSPTNWYVVAIATVAAVVLSGFAIWFLANAFIGSENNFAQHIQINRSDRLKRESVSIPFSIHENNGNPVIDCKINGRNAKLILDTGSEVNCIFEDRLSKFEMDEVGRRLGSGYTAAGQSVRTIKFGSKMTIFLTPELEVEIEHVYILPTRRGLYDADGIIGSPVFEASNAEINYRTHELIINPNKN